MPGFGLFFATHSAYGHTQGNYWRIMVDDICAASHRLGYPCYSIAVETSDAQGRALSQTLPAKPDFVALFNLAEPFKMGLDGRTVFLQEMYEARAVNIMLDHPVHLAEVIARFEAQPPTNSCRSAPPPPPVYGVMEAAHGGVLEALGIGRQRIFVMPQGGPPATEAPVPFASRDIDALFFGTVGALESDDAFRARLGCPGTEILDLVEIALAGDEDVFDAACRLFGCDGSGRAVLATAALARAADLRARLRRRRNLLSNLTDLNLHFCGEVEPDFAARFPRAIFHGGLPFTQVMELVRRAKVVINDTINLRDALLMRVHYAMAEGCVVATEGNRAARAWFRDGGDLLVLEGSAADAGRINALVANRQRWEEMSAAGLIAHAGGHQWDHRVPVFLAAGSGKPWP